MLLRPLNAELKALIAQDLCDPTPRELLSETEVFDQLRAAGWQEIPIHKWETLMERFAEFALTGEQITNLHSWSCDRVEAWLLEVSVAPQLGMKTFLLI
jgi:hypothetical protein